MTETCRPPAAGTHELSLARLIEATPEQCFRAWIERLPDWWGPDGATTPDAKLDACQVVREKFNADLANWTIAPTFYVWEWFTL